MAKEKDKKVQCPSGHDDCTFAHAPLRRNRNSLLNCATLICDLRGECYCWPGKGENLANSEQPRG